MKKLNIALIILAVVSVTGYPYLKHHIDLADSTYTAKYMAKHFKVNGKWNIQQTKEFIIGHPHRKKIVHPKTGSTSISLGHFVTTLVAMELPQAQGNLLLKWAEENKSHLGQQYQLASN